MTAAELLTTLGFEPAGPDPDCRENTRWLRQTTVRQPLISLPPDAGTLDVVDAIYDAGRRDQQTHIQQRHQAYLQSLRILEPLTLPPVA